MVQLDSIRMESIDLLGTGRDKKIQSKNMNPVEFKPMPGTPRNQIQRSRPLGHAG